MTNGDIWREQHGIKTQGASKHANLAAPSQRKPKRKVEPLPLRKPERDGDTLIIPLPLPARELQPNVKTKINSFRLTKLTKATRDGAKFIASMVRPPEPWKRVRIDVTLWGASRLDKVSVLEYLKATIDGVADGIGTNDRNFEPGDIVQVSGKASEGKREVELMLTRVA